MTECYELNENYSDEIVERTQNKNKELESEEDGTSEIEIIKCKMRESS